MSAKSWVSKEEKRCEWGCEGGVSVEKGSSCLCVPCGVPLDDPTGTAGREYSPFDVAMLSLLDLEGMPRGIGSGSCSAGRTDFPDLGTDIGGFQRCLR